MVKMQELMGEYNSYSQGASSSLQGGYKPLQGITRDRAFFPQHGGVVNTAPIATSMIIGVFIGMAVMWGILKKKGQDPERRPIRDRPEAGSRPGVRTHGDGSVCAESSPSF